VPATRTANDGLFIAYEPLTMRGDRLALVGQACAIMDEYRAAGHVMTVRQIYYQLVARDVIPNSTPSYNRLQGALSEGRLQGLVSWDSIEDRGRSLMGLGHSPSVAHTLRHARHSHRLDLWADQPWRPEVWVEKAALEGVVGGICNRLRVDFFSCRGYNSQSEQWRAGRRFAGRIRQGQRPIVFHLGDHDPSGIDMTRDNRDRLSMFAGVPITVSRIALNMPQIEELRPPPNPAKLTDSRSTDYVARYGDSSWELDALSPLYIERLIEESVTRIRDPEIWNRSLQRENEDLRELDEMIAIMGGGEEEDDET